VLRCDAAEIDVSAGALLRDHSSWTHSLRESTQLPAGPRLGAGRLRTLLVTACQQLQRRVHQRLPARVWLVTPPVKQRKRQLHLD
jgi:hypothetical protein